MSAEKLKPVRSQHRFDPFTRICGVGLLEQAFCEDAHRAKFVVERELYELAVDALHQRLPVLHPG
jgi:hypothetical protein